MTPSAPPPDLTPPARPDATAGGVPARPDPVPSEQLLRGGKMLEIVHNGEVYRLQATRLGKLILTK